MFKVISAEIKKILSKPSIYVISLILALILVLGVFVYKPTPKLHNDIVLNGSTYTDKYADFNNTSGGQKKIVADKIEKSKTSVLSYLETLNYQETEKKPFIDNLYVNIETSFYAYRNCANDNSSLAWLNTQKQNLLHALNKLNDEIVSNIAAATSGCYAMLSTKANYNQYTETMENALKWAEMSVQKEDLSEHCINFELSIKPNLEKCLKDFIYPTLSQEFIKTYTTTEEGTKLNKINLLLEDIDNNVEANYNIAITEGIETNLEIANKMDVLANEYINISNTYLNMLKYDLLCNVFNNITTNEQLNLLHINNYDKYTVNSLYKTYEYLFNNNVSETQFATPLTIGTTSNNEINAYDYTYFILKVFSFVLIVYAVLLSCHSIAGEIKDGSMRYFAIRPISRKEIYFGKLIAIIILLSILVIFSSVISFCVGTAVYGVKTLNILTIFNGARAIVIHPAIMILIFLLSLIIELIIYSSIAFLLATLMKSDLFTVAIVLVLYLLNTLLPMFVQGSNSWLTYYPFSHISLYPLFGSAIYANTNFFNLLLGAKVYATTGIGLTIGVIAILIVALNFIASFLFKQKEL